MGWLYEVSTEWEPQERGESLRYQKFRIWQGRELCASGRIDDGEIEFSAIHLGLPSDKTEIVWGLINAGARIPKPGAPSRESLEADMVAAGAAIKARRG